MDLDFFIFIAAQKYFFKFLNYYYYLFIYFLICFVLFYLFILDPFIFII